MTTTTATIFSTSIHPVTGQELNEGWLPAGTPVESVRRGVCRGIEVASLKVGAGWERCSVPDAEAVGLVVPPAWW